MIRKQVKEIEKDILNNPENWVRGSFSSIVVNKISGIRISLDRGIFYPFDLPFNWIELIKIKRAWEKCKWLKLHSLTTSSASQSQQQPEA